jgi:hypothetical protein
MRPPSDFEADIARYVLGVLTEQDLPEVAAEKAVYALRAFWLHKLAARDVDAFDTLGRLLKEVYYPHRSLATRPDERVVGEALGIAELVGIYWSIRDGTDEGWLSADQRTQLERVAREEAAKCLQTSDG